MQVKIKKGRDKLRSALFQRGDIVHDIIIHAGMTSKEKKQTKKNELEQGFIDLGSPNQYPVDDQPGKPEIDEPLTSRDSRLHSQTHFPRRLDW